MTSLKKGFPQVQHVLKTFLSDGGYDRLIVPKLNLVSATEKGEVVCQFQVEDCHLNHIKTIHGGLLSSLIDIGGSLALAARGMMYTGVSTDLNVTFINSATTNDTMIMRSRCERLGGSLGYTSVELLRKDSLSGSEVVVALGRHTKFVRSAHVQNNKL